MLIRVRVLGFSFSFREVSMVMVDGSGQGNGWQGFVLVAGGLRPSISIYHLPFIITNRIVFCNIKLLVPVLVSSPRKL